MRLPSYNINSLLSMGPVVQVHACEIKIMSCQTSSFGNVTVHLILLMCITFPHVHILIGVSME